MMPGSTAIGCTSQIDIYGGTMVRRVLLAVFVLSLIVSAVAQSAPSAPTVVPSSDLKKVVPDSYFFRGLSATTQLRNSSAIHYPDDFYVIVGLVDTSGYSSDVKAKYNGFFITEKKLSFDGGGTLAPGAIRHGIHGRRQVPHLGCRR